MDIGEHFLFFFVALPALNSMIECHHFSPYMSPASQTVRQTFLHHLYAVLGGVMTVEESLAEGQAEMQAAIDVAVAASMVEDDPFQIAERSEPAPAPPTDGSNQYSVVTPAVLGAVCFLLVGMQ